MEILVKKQDELVIIELEGRLDSNTAGNLEKELIPLISADTKKMLIDFSDLNYISSAGLRTLLLAAKKMQSVKGKLALCNMQEFIKEVFELAGFTAIFKIFASPKEAKQFLEA